LRFLDHTHLDTHTHTHTHTHSVALVWTSDQLVQRLLPTKRTTNTRDEQSRYQRDCYPRFQESTGRGPTYEIARPGDRV